MNVPLVDKILYVRTLRNRNIPYNVRQRQPINQNNRGQKPNIPSQQGSSQTNYTVTNTDITSKLQGNTSMYMTLRQVPSPTMNLQT